MDVNIIIRDFEKLKKVAHKSVSSGDYDKALHYIQCAGRLAWNACICFEDKTIEEIIKEISSKLFNSRELSPLKKCSNAVLFIDTICADVRGLGRIYIDALISNDYEIVYVYLKSKEASVQRTLLHLKKYEKARVFGIDDSSIINAVIALAAVIDDGNCGKALVNCGDCDVIASTALYGKDYIESYRISYGDHTYSLGTSIYNHIIEFRDVGVNISQHYRSVEKSKIHKLPFYPNALPDIEFQGFPFDVNGKKLVVSGGQIYKTIDSEHTFYKIVRHMLGTHEDCIFLMLSNGSVSELEEIIKDFPGRAFRLRERVDLNEILKRCTLYLSTYPIAGGTMYQYAVQNGKLPVTLLRNASMQGGFLLNASILNIEFNKYDSFLKELDTLLDKAEYRIKKESLLDNQIITKTKFDQNFAMILKNKSLGIPVTETVVTLQQAQNLVQQALGGMEAYISYLGCYPKVECKIMLKVFPFKTSIGIILKLREKIIYKMRSPARNLKNLKKRKDKHESTVC